MLLMNERTSQYLINCSPSRIAVAFIGRDWHKYLGNNTHLKELIVSPTIGSNPSAIHEVANQIGWENVYLLDNLHAKVYIGDDSAVVGSANLSRNGLDVAGLQELCVAITDDESLLMLNQQFDDWKRLSLKAYPTVESRQKKVGEMKRVMYHVCSVLQDEDISMGTEAESPVTDILDYCYSGDHDFYVCWGVREKTGEHQYSSDVDTFNQVDNGGVHFHKSDADVIKKGAWVLTWYPKDDLTPDRRSITSMHWSYIHEVIPGGVTTEEYSYTTYAFERSDLAKRPEPFDLNAEYVKRAIADVLAEPNFRDAFIQIESAKNDSSPPFLVANTFAKMLDFIERVKQKVRQFRNR